MANSVEGCEHVVLTSLFAPWFLSYHHCGHQVDIILSSSRRHLAVVLSSYCRLNVVTLSSLCSQFVVIVSSLCHHVVIRYRVVTLLSVCPHLVVISSWGSQHKSAGDSGFSSEDIGSGGGRTGGAGLGGQSASLLAVGCCEHAWGMHVRVHA